LNFNRQRGLRIVGAYQISRKGKEAATKNNPDTPGIYDTNALSYSNEAERSATMIITSFYEGELVRQNQARLGWIKNREGVKEGSFLVEVSLEHSKLNTIANSSALTSFTKAAELSQEELLACI